MNLPQSVVRLALRARPHVSPPAWGFVTATASLLAATPTISGPPAGPILAIAPHPDDETIGCGGTLALAADRGEVVEVVLVTDGEATIGGRDRVATGAARRRETRDACHHLGISSPIALGLPDGGVASASDALVDELGRIVARLRPRAILCPWPRDRHPDHLAVAQSVGALGLPPGILVWGYEAHVPLPPNLDATLGLNRWRSLLASQGEGYAEAFLVAPASTWPSLVAGSASDS